MGEKNNNITEEIIFYLLQPYSPFIILIMGLILNIIASSYIQDLSNKYLDILIYIVIFWFLFVLFNMKWERKLKTKEEQIIRLEESINVKDRQIEQNSGVIFNKYSELAKFNKNQKFQNILKSLVNSNTLIQYAQIYSYSIKIKHNIAVIKVNLEESYTYENVETNGIIQTYFDIDLLDYKELKDIVEIWKFLYCNDENVSDIENSCLSQEFSDKATNLLTKIVNVLNSIKGINDLQEKHFSYYRIALILIKILFSAEHHGIDIQKLIQNEEIEDYINNVKRTGILGGILLEDSYSFKHEGGLKNGRMYYTFDFKVYDENYILLVSIPSNDLNDKIKWERELNKIKNDFILRTKDTNL